jgi:hypothetical protein
MRSLNNFRFLGLLFLVSCAGMERDCSSGCNSNFGADWVVLQYGYDGTPINCWKLSNIAISNESHTDGIFWQASSGNLVHISGWYNRVQVTGGQWPGAAQQLGIDMAGCTEGKYIKPTHASVDPIAPIQGVDQIEAELKRL